MNGFFITPVLLILFQCWPKHGRLRGPLSERGPQFGNANTCIYKFKTTKMTTINAYNMCTCASTSKHTCASDLCYKTCTRSFIHCFLDSKLCKKLKTLSIYVYYYFYIYYANYFMYAYFDKQNVPIYNKYIIDKTFWLFHACSVSNNESESYTLRETL